MSICGLGREAYPTIVGVMGMLRKRFVLCVCCNTYSSCFTPLPSPPLPFSGRLADLRDDSPHHRGLPTRQRARRAAPLRGPHCGGKEWGSMSAQSVTQLSHYCHTAVTLLSYSCHIIVTLLSHYCHLPPLDQWSLCARSKRSPN